MADHRIMMQAPKVELGRLDVVFEVFVDDKRAGELHLSEGGVDWWPRGAKSVKRTKSWTELRAFLES